MPTSATLFYDSCNDPENKYWFLALFSKVRRAIIQCPISSNIGCYEPGLTCSGAEAPSDNLRPGLGVDTPLRPEAVSVGAEAAGAGA